MKRIAIVLALALAACTPTVGSVEPVVQTVQLEGTRAVAMAELAYQTLGTAALSGRRSGLIGDETWQRIQALDVRVNAALEAGNAATAFDLIDQVRSLIPSSLLN